MKSKEFHRFIRKQGWRKIRQAGSHVVYEKDGIFIVVPYHGAKEIAEPLRRKILRDMGL